MKNGIIRSYIYGLYHNRVKTLFFNDKLTARRRKKMYLNTIIDVDAAHERIANLLNGKKPVMIARYGFNEATIIGMYCLLNKTFLPKKYGKIEDVFYSNTGFFSNKGIKNNEDIERYAKLMINDAKEADMIGIHYGMFEDYLINTYSSNAILTEFDNLRIMASNNSWGKALKNKRILVIYPFEKTIIRQYKNINNIWGNKNIMPKFKLLTYKPVQTIAYNNIENYLDWFEALDKMKSDISKIDFDIAIIGCGAYGFPLAAECKRLGKKAIHLGGQTQLMFGILGRRYENNKYYEKFINEYWVHPLEEEKIKNWETVEGGCYW